MLGSIITFLILNITDIKYTKENLGYLIFSLSILSLALMILISSFKGRKENIHNLNLLITKKNFDEVIIKSANEESINYEMVKTYKSPYLIFFKEKGKTIFHMMLMSNDLKAVHNFINELKGNQSIRLVSENKDIYNKNDYPASFIPDFA